MTNYEKIKAIMDFRAFVKEHGGFCSDDMYMQYIETLVGVKAEAKEDNEEEKEDFLW